MDSRLTFVEELERRDADAAEALSAVERLQANVDELRTYAAAAAAFLASLPGALEERAADERAVVDARERAEQAVREAEQLVERAGKEQQRLEAEQALHDARDELHTAEFWVSQAREAHAELARQGEARQAEADELGQRAVELAPRVRDVPPPSPDLAGALDWASRARGALLLEHSALAREREVIVREAAELLGSVIGDPFVATGVAGVRERLARALADSSP